MLHVLSRIFRLCRGQNHFMYSSIAHQDFIPGTYDPKNPLSMDSQDQTTVKNLLKGLLKQDRSMLAKAITLIESQHPKKRFLGQMLLQLVISEQASSTHRSFRIGLSGPPGAGKSTFIETLGTYLTDEKNLKVAVLAVDPSSSRTGGSLLGDKTRMTHLSRNPRAYIRPSPAQGTLGGVTRTTTEAMTLCESAAYDVIIIETVGVGQSEVAVSNMTDMFLLLIPPASGDELQGIKRGIVELVDMVIINKSDGDLVPAARRIQAEYTSALKFMPRKHQFWKQKVRRVSSITGEGVRDLWDVMKSYQNDMIQSGDLDMLRREQRTIWMWNHIKDNILDQFIKEKGISEALPNLEKKVENCEITPGLASDILLRSLFGKSKIT